MLPDRSRIVLANGFVGGDEPGKSVSLCVSDNETVEGIAGPLFVESGASDDWKRKVAEAGSELVFDFVLNVASGALTAFYFVEVLKLKQNHRRKEQIGLLEQAVNLGAESNEAAIGEPGESIGIEIRDHRLTLARLEDSLRTDALGAGPKSRSQSASHSRVISSSRPVFSKPPSA